MEPFIASSLSTRNVSLNQNIFVEAFLSELGGLRGNRIAVNLADAIAKAALVESGQHSRDLDD